MEHESKDIITPVLRQIRGGRSLALKAMRFADGELIRLFLDRYDKVPKRDKQTLTFEEIAIAASVNPKHLWGEIMLAMREYEVSTVKLLAMQAHPDVMKARIEFAQTPGGYRDRDKLDEILGAIKPSSGTTFISNAFFGGKPKEEDEDDDDTGEPDEENVDFVFPDCQDMQARVAPMRQKLLEAK